MCNRLLKETRERLLPLRGIKKHRLLEATKKVDELMNKIEVANITELNDLVYAGTVVVKEMLGAKNRKSTGSMEKENGSTSKTIKQRPWAY